MSSLSKIIRQLKSQTARCIQNQYDFSLLKKAQKAIVFLTPGESLVNGGVMSIYSLCRYSRELNPAYYCCICTYPHKLTYARNTAFPNQERILRFEKFLEQAAHIQELILHVPEYYSEFLYEDLSPQERAFLKQIPKLHINIMNQNIQLMPPAEKIKSLYSLTAHITQTTAHNRYANQQICDQWQMPVHLFSVYLPIEEYKRYPFENKTKTVVFSPDETPHKQKVAALLKQHLKGWKFVTVKKLTFSQYMELISRSFFTITFGEGFDGYFTQPCRIGSLAFAVYNDKFFPSPDWKQLKNIYESDEEMEKRIVEDILYFSTHPEEYMQTAQKTDDLRKTLYSKEKFLDNLRRFYRQEYDFYPKQK